MGICSADKVHVGTIKLHCWTSLICVKKLQLTSMKNSFKASLLGFSDDNDPEDLLEGVKILGAVAKISKSLVDISNFLCFVT